MYRALEAAWAKYNKASRDLARLHDNRKRFLEQKPYRVDVELEPDTGWWVARTRIVAEPPPVFGVHVGSLAHQLYSALNHVTYALAVRELGEAKAHKRRFDLDFPITDDPSKFNYAKLREHVGHEAAATMEQLQPYHREPGGHGRIEHPLLLVKEFADADKHRVLAASYGTIDLREVFSCKAFVWNRDVAPTGEFGRTLPSSDEVITLQDGTELLRIRFDAGNAAADLRVEPQPEADIVFESDTWGGISIWRVGDCIATVDRCISKLAALFPDEPWPPDDHDPSSPYAW